MGIDIALQEITYADRCGPPHPNDISSHPPFWGQHLYAFKWASAHFQRKMYMKFALVEGMHGKEAIAIYSFHEARR